MGRMTKTKRPVTKRIGQVTLKQDLPRPHGAAENANHGTHGNTKMRKVESSTNFLKSSQIGFVQMCADLRNLDFPLPQIISEKA